MLSDLNLPSSFALRPSATYAITLKKERRRADFLKHSAQICQKRRSALSFLRLYRAKVLNIFILSGKIMEKATIPTFPEEFL